LEWWFSNTQPLKRLRRNHGNVWSLLPSVKRVQTSSDEMQSQGSRHAQEMGKDNSKDFRSQQQQSLTPVKLVVRAGDTKRAGRCW